MVSEISFIILGSTDLGAHGNVTSLWWEYEEVQAHLVVDRKEKGIDRWIDR